MGQKTDGGPSGHLQPPYKPGVILVAGQQRGSEVARTETQWLRQSTGSPLGSTSMTSAQPFSCTCCTRDLLLHTDLKGLKKDRRPLSLFESNICRGEYAAFHFSDSWRARWRGGNLRRITKYLNLANVKSTFKIIQKAILSRFNENGSVRLNFHVVVNLS